MHLDMSLEDNHVLVSRLCSPLINAAEEVSRLNGVALLVDPQPSALEPFRVFFSRLAFAPTKEPFATGYSANPDLCQRPDDGRGIS
jgi:hypothetical protein